MIKWQWSLFDELSLHDLYEVLKVRQAVFVVEQGCAYQDVDELDQVAWHLIGWHEDAGFKKIVAYLRVVYPEEKFSEPSIGRVLVTPELRKSGLGKKLIAEAIVRISDEYPDSAIRISAQKYLEVFYSDFGFTTVSSIYEEDGIPHIEMLRS
ncbi:GNAT family N-acetyltransferase [Methyloprofundus sp.]|uniref:GNAT family N-acetyltransferase n=1 Tax=Methyloprofundus sp. TaxID=2020875 RepID=UPI003D0B0B32